MISFIFFNGKLKFTAIYFLYSYKRFILIFEFIVVMNTSYVIRYYKQKKYYYFLIKQYCFVFFLMLAQLDFD